MLVSGRKWAPAAFSIKFAPTNRTLSLSLVLLPQPQPYSMGAALWTTPKSSVGQSSFWSQNFFQFVEK